MSLRRTLNKLRLKYRYTDRKVKIAFVGVTIVAVVCTSLVILHKPKTITLGKLKDTEYDYLANPKDVPTEDNEEDMKNFFEHYNELEPSVQASWYSLASSKMKDLGLNVNLPTFVERPKFKIKGKDGEDKIKEVEEHVFQIENSCKAIELIDQKFDIANDNYPNVWHVKSVKYFNDIINKNIVQLQHMHLSEYFDAFKIDYLKAININRDREEFFTKGVMEDKTAYRPGGIGLCKDLREQVQEAVKLYIK